MEKIVHEPADITIYLRDKGVVAREKSLIAFEQESGRILAAGTRAAQYAGRVDEGIRMISPLRQGMVDDFQAAAALFCCLLQETWGKKHRFIDHALKRHDVVLCLPLSDGMGQVDKKAWEDVLYQSGAKKTMLFQGPYAELAKPSREAYQICIEIGKAEPERYLEELFMQAVRFADRAGITAADARALFLDVLGADWQGVPRQSLKAQGL